jgi:hypothetical protein
LRIRFLAGSIIDTHESSFQKRQELASTGASTSSPLVANFVPSFPDELAAHGYRGNAAI